MALEALTFFLLIPMQLKKVTLVLTAILFCTGASTRALAQVNIAANGKSALTIVIPAAAPASVQNAAQELQKCVELATGAKLPLQKDDAPVSTPILSIGSTRQAEVAGLDSGKMADESFRITTQNGNLFILGPDTPDGGWTKNNGASNGTANGVYTFLEDYLNVRWLMPGEIGRDVPKRSTLALEKLDRSMTPKFSWRRVTHLWDYSNAPQQRSIAAWGDRQRIGGAVQLDYDHNWWRAVNDNKSSDVNTPAVKALYAAHPEWFAMNAAGKRPFPDSHYAKFETTNPELVRWFADKAIAALKASERPRTFSLSPSDGGGRWSKSPESKALYDPNPAVTLDPEAAATDPSTSSLVLKWYHDVAQIVAKEYPQGRLAGYIYSSYVYPPQKVAMKLPDNFTPVICGIGTYGYGLYRPENQKQWKWVMDSWAKVAPENWYYYDLPNQLLRQYEPEIGEVNFPGATGIITPAAPDILNTIFPQLVKSHIKGSYIYGVPSWSNAALGNYLLTKMTWDPTLNADELQKEWLHRAYGPQAGAVMEEFYTKLNGWFREYYQQNAGLSYKLTLGMLKDIYATHYPEMEKLLLQARAQPMSQIQQQRLQLLEDNLVVLQWRLKNAGFLPAAFTSPLSRDDAQISALLTKENDDFALFPGATTSDVVGWDKSKPLPWKVQLAAGAQPIAEGSTPSGVAPGLADSQFLIYAARDGEIRIVPQLVTQGAYFPAYQLKDQSGATLQNGILQTGAPIVFRAKANSAYTLSIPSRKAVNYQLLVEDAAVASAGLQNGTLTLSGPPAPVYVFYAPQSTPVGILADEKGVAIKKPYSGAAAEKVMGADYTDVRVLNALDDGWKFSPDPQNDGIARGVLKADFDDSSWKPITALDWWQMQGFPDYHGVAWYRLKFQSKPLKEGERARLYFGAVDGNAVVYLNGEKLTEHTLEPDFKGWDRPFSTYLGGSSNYKLRPGENVLVVQVTSKNATTASGIFKGVAIVAGTRKAE
jgi:hypothetical protein